MPGRQAHGRPLLASKPAPKSSKKSKSKTQARALDAFGIAQERFPTKEKRTPRFREIEGDSTKKHRRAEEEDDDEGEDDGDEDEDEQPRRKKAKPSRPADGDEGSDEYGSDSEGNEWRYGVGKDDDSDLDSDEAFGDSDNEKFEGFAFGGSSSKSHQKKKNKKQADSDDDDEFDDPDDFEAGDDGEDLGDEAIDLAQALDMASEESEEEGEDGEGSDISFSEEDEDADSESSEDDEDADPSKLDALHGFIDDFGGEKGKNAETTTSKPKLTFKDLGLSAAKDPHMKKAMKLMTKEDKETRPGAGKKLAVPLAQRQQDKLLRAAAYEKTSETLDRWTDTVKANRRAEHLVFPLPENAQDAGLNHDELQPITAKNTSNELEQTILSIMERSGLALTKHEEKNRAQAEAEEGLSKEALQELVNQKRKQRELNSREAKRQARIKKIKSKAYHRVHRKQKERDELKLHEAMVEAGEIDSEEERLTHDRARALERVGARHRESRWAKAGAGNKRAVWDDDYRAGLHDMARKEEELRRRKEGRAAGAASDDDDDSDDASVEGGNRDLMAQLDRLDNMDDDDEPQSNLMKMKFMQKAEAAQKKANDDMIAQIRRDLDSDADENDSQEEVTEIGRRKFGGEKSASKPAISGGAKAGKKTSAAAASDADASGWSGPDGAASLNIGHSITAPPASTGNAWSSGEPRKKGKKAAAAAVDTINTADIIHAGSKPKPSNSSSALEDPDSDTDLHLPLAIRDVAQLDKAFAGDNVVVDFEAQKSALAEEQDDKVIDNTLPGWGSWVGDGVSARDKARHKGRFLTKVEGTKKKDRKDAKLAKVIINEKRVKNNDKYLATQLPHPFESRAQYERALRLPMGPEWMTKESFQEAVKPRLLMKQGIIAPMSRPSR